MLWIFLAFGTAVSTSISQAYNNYVVSLRRFSKFTVIFCANVVGSLLLFFVSYYIGFPEIRSGFWFATIVTTLLNFVANPLLLKGYEIGEFSSVFSMILLSPIFLLGTSFFFLDEVPSALGIIGVFVTVAGLIAMTRNSHTEERNFTADKNFKMGNMCGIGVALLWAISVNYDKISAQTSNAFFAAAVISALLALLNGAYLLYKQRHSLFSAFSGWTRRDLGTLPLLGVFYAITLVLHNSALLLGYAAYTIAIKRTGILFGVLWGKLFFKEKGFLKKLTGAAIAVSGVLMILVA